MFGRALQPRRDPAGKRSFAWLTPGECKAYIGVVRRRNTTFPNEELREAAALTSGLLDQVTEFFTQPA